MSVFAPELESELSVDQIEARLIHAAEHHHLEERNIAYWLHEIEKRGLHRERGFSSIGDYAMELTGIKPRKAQYLVFIVSRLKKLPLIRAAFDAGELAWTKAREIVSVATSETEAAWLEKARTLTNRELEEEVRRHDGRGSGPYATVTISMPAEVLEMWNDAFELAERLAGGRLEKWQVLEPALAEFLSTHLPEDGAGEQPSESEDGLAPDVRLHVLNRDGWQCQFPGCTMRKMLDVHHIEFRSHSGSDEPGNLISVCRIHHGLIHRGVCKITGTVGVDLEFVRPRLVTEKPPEPSPSSEPLDEASEPGFDGPPSSIFEPTRDYGDFIAQWAEREEARRLRMRSSRRRAQPASSGEHVFAETTVGMQSRRDSNGAVVD